MKRRCWEFSTSPPSRIPTSSQRDIKRGKRVKFTDDEVDYSNPQSFRMDASSVPVGAVKPTKRSADGAKTAEFAFFKKLKENAGAKLPPHSEYSEQIDQSGNSNIIKNENKEFRSSSMLVNATPFGFVSFKSPLGSACTPINSNARRKEACTTFNNVLQRPQDVEDYSHPFRPQGQGILDGNGDIFSMKRQKLNQWVRDISFPEASGLNLKGHDIVHKLLRRLISENKDKNNLKDQKFGQAETDAKSISNAYPDSDRWCKKLQKTNGIGLIEPELGSYHGDDIMCHRPDRFRGKILYLDAPYSHDNTRNHWPKVWESDSKFDREKHSLWLTSDEPVEELGVIPQANRYLLESHLKIGMLRSDFGTNKENMNFSMDIQDIEPMDYRTSLIPWVPDREFDGPGLFSLPRIHINEGTSLIPWVDDRKFDAQNLFPLPNHDISEEPETSSRKFDARNLFPSPNIHINEGRLIPWVDDRKVDARNLFPLPSHRINEETERTSLIPWVNDSKFEARNLFLLPNNHIDEESEHPLPLSLASSHRSHRYENEIPVIEAERNILADPNDIPLPLSFRNIDFSPLKDSYNETGFLNQDPRFISKIFSQTEYIVPVEHVLGLDVTCFPIRSSPRDLYTSSRRSLGYPTDESVIYHYDERDKYELP